MCTACGKDQPTILTAQDDIHATMLATHAINLDSLPIVNVVSGISFLSVITECANCGYQRQFSSGQIYEWLDEEKKGTES